MKIRSLGADEHEALLDLLDLWPVPDGWRGREFFRRTLEQDETFRGEQVVVGEEVGRLVACVQIFPRPVRLLGRRVAMGGIGSVFTRPGHRGAGVATALLEEAARRMRARGMAVSLLFSGASPLYHGLGWRSWGARMLVLSRDGAPRGPAAAGGTPVLEPFRPERLAAVEKLHRSYSGRLDGTVIRDEALWRTSLHVAGNPDEEFLLACEGGEPVAYARAIALNGVLAISELGRAADAAPALAALVSRMLTPRERDPLARDRPSRELRRFAVLSHAGDAELLSGLAERGVAVRPVDDPSVMWRCLDAPRLAEALGVPVARSESDEDYLRRVFPPGRFTYWRADRF